MKNRRRNWNRKRRKRRTGLVDLGWRLVGVMTIAVLISLVVFGDKYLPDDRSARTPVREPGVLNQGLSDTVQRFREPGGLIERFLAQR